MMMLENEIKSYFDLAEPDNELIERVIVMTNNEKRNKRISFSKKTIAIIAAIVCALSVTVASASIIRIHNDNSNIIGIDSNDGSFILDFENAQRSPIKLSDTNNDIVKAIADKGFRDIIIPAALINDGYRLENQIAFLPQYTSAMFDFKNSSGKIVSVSIIQDIAESDLSGFWGTGDENSTGEVINVNGMDVVVAYMGDDEIGYAGLIFYANGNTIYQITYSADFDFEKSKQDIIAFVNTLAQ